MTENRRYAHDHLRPIFQLALIPGLIPVLVLLVAVREPPHEAVATRALLKFGYLQGLGGAYWTVAGIAPSAFAPCRSKPASFSARPTDSRPSYKPAGAYLLC